MSVCSPCGLCKPIPFCAEAIVIGTGDALTDYVVHFLNTANGRSDIELVTSDAYGAIEVEWINRQERATYEISLWQGVEFEVDGFADPVLCVSVSFDRLNDIAPASYTLTAAE